MQESDMGKKIIIELLAWLIVGPLIGAVLLRAASKWAAKLDVPFGRAYLTVLTFSIVNGILRLVLGFVLACAWSTEGVDILPLIMLGYGFLVASGIISWRLRVSFGTACRVAITFIIMMCIAGVICVLVDLLIASGSW